MKNWLQNNTQTYRGYTILPTSISDPDGTLHWMTFIRLEASKEDVMKNAVEIIDKELGDGNN